MKLRIIIPRLAGAAAKQRQVHRRDCLGYGRGTTIQQWTCTKGTNQQFAFR